MSPLLGQAACLGAASIWAFSVALFRSPIAAHGPAAVNLVKCTFATLLLLATTLVAGYGPMVTDAPSADLALIAASGVVGLTLGDTALFAAVDRVGAHRTLLLQTLAPLFTAAVAFAWYGAVPTLGQTGGALMILAGVALVVAPEDGSAAGGSSAGLLFGVLAAAGQGVGIVLAKAGMAEVSPLPAAFVRLAAAAVGLVAIALFTGGLGTARGVLASRPSRRRVIPATLLGTYLAMLLMMAGIALAPAAIAAVLLATTPVFSLVFEAIELRRLPSGRGIAGTLLAVVGVGVLTLLARGGP